MKLLWHTDEEERINELACSTHHVLGRKVNQILWAGEITIRNRTFLANVSRLGGFDCMDYIGSCCETYDDLGFFIGRCLACVTDVVALGWAPFGCRPRKLAMFPDSEIKCIADRAFEE